MTAAVEVDTGLGPARAQVYPGLRSHRVDPARATTLVLGHGAGGGVDARDLVALAAALPPTGVTVALVEQPWRVAGHSVAGRPVGLDQAWCAVLADPTFRADSGLDDGARLVCGGRSAGARVACRTAAAVGADAVVALAFPLYPPGRVGEPERSRAGELLAVRRPLLIVQGGRDAFGRPEDFADPGRVDVSGVAQVVSVPHADHGFAVPRRLDLGPTYAVDLVVAHVATFLAALT
jgi:predicted alpha/beta-hydrolase family hydrolase